MRIGKNKYKAKEEKLKIILTIFKTYNGYYAVMGIEEIPEFISNKKVVYQNIQEGEDRIDSRTMVREMRKKAVEWARKKGIPFVHNLDLSLYN